MCHKGPKLQTKLPTNITEKVVEFKELTESSVILEDGDELFIDSVIFCTGYTYDFSFLPKGTVEIGESKNICNIFKTIVSVQYSNLFVMGVLRNGSFFKSGECTAKFISGVLDGTVKLPDENCILDIVKED